MRPVKNGGGYFWTFRGGGSLSLQRGGSLGKNGGGFSGPSGGGRVSLGHPAGDLIVPSDLGSFSPPDQTFHALTLRKSEWIMGNVPQRIFRDFRLEAPEATPPRGHFFVKNATPLKMAKFLSKM